MAIQVVSFRCILKDKLGRVLSNTVNQNVLTHGPQSPTTLSALSEALQDLRKGERREVSLRAEEAYGFYDPTLVIVKPINEITMSAPVKQGEKIIYLKDGRREVFRVTEVTGESVTLDGNHPLAGQDLVFEIETMEAREATEQEIAEANAPSTEHADVSSGLH